MQILLLFQNMKIYKCKIAWLLIIICFENLKEQQYDFTLSDLASKWRSKVSCTISHRRMTTIPSSSQRLQSKVLKKNHEGRKAVCKLKRCRGDHGVSIKRNLIFRYPQICCNEGEC